jgi:hypothetical protein
LHATNLDVPDEFVTEWIFEDDDNDPRPPGFYFLVFSFGYLQYELMAGPLPPSIPRTVPVSRLVQHFEKWQMKLVFAQLHRRTDIQFEPMPLFAFPEGEELRYWPRPGAMTPPLDVA